MINAGDKVLAFDTFSVALPVAILNYFIDFDFYIRTGGDMVHEEYIESTHDLITLPEFYERLKTNNLDLSFKQKIKQFLTYFIYKKAKHIFFNSEWQRGIMIKAGYAHHDTSSVIINPVEFENDFVPNSHVTSQKVFIAKTRPVYFKNHELLKKAFDELHDIDAILDTAVTTRENLLHATYNAYALILPSISDICPNTVTDSLALGTPVIMTSSSGLTELVSDYVYFIDDVRDVPSIKKAILDFLNPDIYKIYKDKALKFAIEKKWPQNTQSMCEQYYKAMYNNDK
jgi:glycosyltransferase involved in cell wall biosynthesis